MCHGLDCWLVSLHVAFGYDAAEPKLAAGHELAQPAVAGVHVPPPGLEPELALLAVGRVLALALELAVAFDS